MRKEERFKVDDLKLNRKYKDRIRLRTKVNIIENRQSIEIISKTKDHFLKRQIKFENFQQEWSRKKEEKAQTANWRTKEKLVL